MLGLKFSSRAGSGVEGREGRCCLRLRWILLSLLASAALSLGGCATPEESDNASVRPWGAPGPGWNNGSLPSTLTEGR